MLLAMALAGCAASLPVNEREVRIRYVNVPLIYEYMARSDSDAQRAMRRGEETRAIVERLEREIRAPGDEGAVKRSGERLEAARLEMNKARAAEEAHKQRLLTEMNRAMELVATRLQVDYILNTGESLVYFKKEFDITEAVLQEVMAQRKRNAPVSR
jgi:Skp family chaperone for outer membrane proteins